jgi:hypothetical protein
MISNLAAACLGFLFWPAVVGLLALFFGLMDWRENGRVAEAWRKRDEEWEKRRQERRKKQND